MCTMPAPYPQEFRDDVVRVAQNREPGTHLKQIAKDFGISFSCLTNWMRQAEIEAGKNHIYDPAAVDACVALFRQKGFKFN